MASSTTWNDVGVVSGTFTEVGLFSDDGSMWIHANTNATKSASNYLSIVINVNVTSD